MSIVSLPFIYFAILLAAVYFALNKIKPEIQWIALFIGSIYFYISSAGKCAGYVFYVIILTWICGSILDHLNRRIETIRANGDYTKAEKKEKIAPSELKKKIVLAFSLILLFSMLVLLKNTGWIAGRLNKSIDQWLIMPLGVSFFTFLGAGYCIDIYRGMVPSESNLFRYALYICYFPHICQGPLDNYAVLAPQLYAPHSLDWKRMRTGMERTLIGYFKKIIVANQLGLFVNSIYSSPEEYSGIVLAWATLMYVFQLYADFSGYMDIMCGISYVLGIQITENFRTPYFSGSIAEYWRRWHISLGAWFRDYLYYPLMRSPVAVQVSKRLRKSGHKKIAQMLTTSCALAITWLVIGYWHGVTDNYIAFSVYHGSFVILAGLLCNWYFACRRKLRIDEESRAWQLFRTIRTFILVFIGDVLFRSTSVAQAFMIYKRFFTQNFYFGWSAGLFSTKFDTFYWLVMVASIGLCVIIDIIEQKKNFLIWLNSQKRIIRWGFLYVIMLSIACAVLFGNVKEASAGNFIYYYF